MKILFFVDGNYQNRISRIEQTLRQFQTFLHHRKPLAVPVGIVAIHVVVIVFPVTSPCVIGWVDVDTIHLSGIEVLQQLECMVVVRLDQRVPQVTVWRIADCVQWLQIGIDGLTELGHTHQHIYRQHDALLRRLVETGSLSILDFLYIVDVRNLSVLLGHDGTALYRDIVKRCGLRQMLFKYQTEFLLAIGPLHLCANPLTQGLVRNLANQIV